MEVITKELLDVLNETILLFLRQLLKLSTEVGEVEDFLLGYRRTSFLSKYFFGDEVGGLLFHFHKTKVI
jgi:hypothetical protein